MDEATSKRRPQFDRGYPQVQNDEKKVSNNNKQVWLMDKTIYAKDVFLKEWTNLTRQENLKVP